MTRQCQSTGQRDHRGFTLIELMVSITIGLLISIAAVSAYLGASTSSKMADAQARMNEDAQAALTILAQQIRMAGSNPKQAGRTDKSRLNPVYKPYPISPPPYSIAPNSFSLSAFTIRGCNSAFSNLLSAPSLDDLRCAPAANGSTNSIAVSYEADAFNTVPASGNLPADCVGVALNQIAATFTGEAPPGPFSYYVADNRFYIGLARATAAPTLYCKGNGVASTAQPLVENIEDLQLSYGAVALATLAENVNTANVAGYLSADGLTGLSGVQDDPVPWQKVIAVRICVLVRSEGLVMNDLSSGSYLNCAGALTTPSDRRLRRAYYATVVLRNRRP